MAHGGRNGGCLCCGRTRSSGSIADAGVGWHCFSGEQDKEVASGQAVAGDGVLSREKVERSGI
jgi:hypothetical protein